MTGAVRASTPVETWTDFDVDRRAVAPCVSAMGERVMVAIVDWENRGTPRPWSIGVNLPNDHYSYYFGDEDTAVRAAVYLVEHGYTNLDLGLAQLNSMHVYVNGVVSVLDMNSAEARRNESALSAAFVQAFEPCNNVQQGSLILRGFYNAALKEYHNEAVAMERALRAYNSGSFNASIDYGLNVWKIAAALPPSIGASERSEKGRMR